MTAAFPTVTVTVDFAPVASGYLILNDATAGKLNTGQLAPNVATDVSTYVQDIDISRGSQRFAGPTIRYDAGTCTIVFINTDGRFDPTNLSGPYVAAGATQVTPMRKVVVTATWQGIVYSLFTGYADSWAVDWSNDASTVTMVATDGTKVLGNYNGPAVAEVGAGEDTGARINRILDNAGWATTDRIIQTGVLTVQATTMAQPAWTEILLTADSEGGQVYVDGAGRVMFRNQTDVFTNPRSNTSQATFGDGTGEIPFESIAPDYDDTQLANLIRIARVGGVEQIAEDAASQSLNLVRTFERTDLVLMQDEDCANIAGQVLYQWKDPELRVASITVHPSALSGTTAFTAVLGAAFGDRQLVRRRPPAQSGTLVERQVFVRGVRHTISNLDWHTTLTYQSATKWATSFFTLNSSSLGVLNTNALTY